MKAPNATSLCSARVLVPNKAKSKTTKATKAKRGDTLARTPKPRAKSPSDYTHTAENSSHNANSRAGRQEEEGGGESIY